MCNEKKSSFNIETYIYFFTSFVRFNEASSLLGGRESNSNVFACVVFQPPPTPPKLKQPVSLIVFLRPPVQAGPKLSPHLLLLIFNILGQAHPHLTEFRTIATVPVIFDP